MKICIHRGATQIGGTCVELEFQGMRVLYKSSEQPGYDDGLHPFVSGNGYKSAVDGTDGPAFAQGEKQEQGPENDEEDLQGNDHPVENGGQDPVPRGMPDQPGEEDGDPEGHGHGTGGRPAESHHE